MLETNWQQRKKIFYFSRFSLVILTPLVLIVLILDLWLLPNFVSPSLCLILMILVLVNFIIYSVFSQIKTIEHYHEIWRLNHEFFPWFLLVYLTILILHYLKIISLSAFFVDYLSFLLILSGLLALANLAKIQSFLKRTK